MKYLVVFLLFTIPFISNAQCKAFAKKNCVPQMKPFMFNGQINTVKLSEGEMAELDMTFQANQSYRVYVCSMGAFEHIEFRVVDAKTTNILFNNKDHDYINSWDFNVKSMQDVIIRVLIPPSIDKKLFKNEGCVSILIGFKDL